MTHLTTGVGPFLTDVQFVISILHRTTGHRTFADQPTHIVIGVIGCATEGAGKPGHIAQKIVGYGAGIVGRILHGGVPPKAIIGIYAAVIHRVGDGRHLAQLRICITSGLAHRVGYTNRQIQAVEYSLADRIALRVQSFHHIAVGIINGGKHIAPGIRDSGASAKCIITVTNHIVKRILDCNTLVQAVIGVGGSVIQSILYREQVVVCVIGIGSHIILCISCRQAIAICIVSIDLSVAQCIGLAQQIACGRILVHSTARHGVDNLGNLGHSVVFIEGGVAIVISLRKHITVTIISLGGYSTLGVNFLYDPTRSIIFITNNSTIRKVLCNHSTSIVVNNRVSIIGLVRHSNKPIFTVVIIADSVSIGEGYFLIFQVAVIGI